MNRLRSHSRTGMWGTAWHWVAAALSGGLQALSLAWPGSGQPLWWLQLAALALLVWALGAQQSVARAAWLGWLSATVWLASTFWWLFISMHVYGGLAAPLAVLAVLGLAAFLGSYYAVACALWQRWRPQGCWAAALLWAALWTLAELARGLLWTGFPWGAGGYAHVEGPLSALPRWVGVYGTGALASVLAALFVGAMQTRVALRKGLLAGMVMAMGLGGLHWHRIQALQSPAETAHAPFSLALLQGNIPQNEKFEQGSGIPQALRWYGQTLRSVEADLVVAPETAIPLLPSQLMPGYLEQVAQPYVQPDAARAVLVGIPLGSLREGYTNSVLGWQSGQSAPYRYDKHHLVPFGEFIPPLFRWFTEMMHIPLGDFSRGALVQPSLHWRAERIAPNICYEDLFGEEIGARFVDASVAPTVLVNFSNIGWFGDSVAVDQHLQISRMRSLEFERPMVRATNTGATAVIDHTGAVTHRLPAFSEGVLHAQVQGRSGAVTPYAAWVARWGLWPLWIACLSVVLAMAWSRRTHHGASRS